MMTGELNWDINFFLDEKGFNELTIGSYYLSPKIFIMEDASESCAHKNHIPKAMHFTTVQNPVAEFSFDRRIVFWPLLKEILLFFREEESFFDPLPWKEPSLTKQ